jgi:hypothetical protein
VPKSATHVLKNVPSSSIEAGGPVMWFGDVAPDQRPTDAFSLVYDTDPVEEEFEILGLPRAVLQVSADAPLAQWYVLCDIAPDGAVTLVASAGQNGAHRESDENPKALPVGQEFPSRSSCTSRPGPSRRAIACAWPSTTPTGRCYGPPLPRDHHPASARARGSCFPSCLSRSGRGRPSCLRLRAEPVTAYGTVKEETTGLRRDRHRRAGRAERLHPRHRLSTPGPTSTRGARACSTRKIVHEVQDEHPERRPRCAASTASS